MKNKDQLELDEIRKKAQAYLALSLKEWERLIEEGNEEDLRLVIERLHFSHFVSVGESWEEVDCAYAHVESLVAEALKRLREEFKPKSSQDFKQHFEKLEEILEGIKDEEIQKEIILYGGYAINWRKPASLLGGFLHISYRWDVASIDDFKDSLGCRSYIPSYIRKKLSRKIKFPYSGFVKQSSEDQYINNVISPGGVITPVIPVSPEEIAKELNELVEQGYLPPTFSLEIKEFFKGLIISSSIKAKRFLKDLEESFPEYFNRV